MSDVTRYGIEARDPGWCKTNWAVVESDDGHLVRHEDYERIKADRDRLAAELADAQSDLSGVQAILDAERTELDTLRAELSAARDALRTYGGHFDDCAGTAGCLDPRCDCGYANVIRAVDRADPSAEGEST